MKIMSSMLRASFSHHFVAIANNTIKLAIAPTTRKFIMMVKIAESNPSFESELWFSDESIKSDIVLDVLIGLPAGAVGVGGRQEWNYVGRTTYTLNRLVAILSSVLSEKPDLPATAEPPLGACMDVGCGIGGIGRDPFSPDYCDDGMTTAELEMFRSDVLTL